MLLMLGKAAGILTISIGVLYFAMATCVNYDHGTSAGNIWLRGPDRWQSQRNRNSGERQTTWDPTSDVSRTSLTPKVYRRTYTGATSSSTA